MRIQPTVTADHTNEGVLFAGEDWDPGEVNIVGRGYTIARPDGGFSVTLREIPPLTDTVVFEQHGTVVEVLIP